LPVDLLKAREYFEAAASTGLLPEADEALGIFAANGFGYPAATASSSDGGGSSSGSGSGNGEGFTSSNGGDGDDDVDGDIHATAPGTPDYAAARRHLKRAATPQAWTLLGDLYQWGQLDDVIRNDLNLPPVAPESSAGSGSSGSGSGGSRGFTHGRNGRDQQQQQRRGAASSSQKKGQPTPSEAEAQGIQVAERANLKAWHLYSLAAASDHSPALTAMGTMVLFGTAPQNRSRGNGNDSTETPTSGSSSSSGKSQKPKIAGDYGTVLPGAAEGAAAEAAALAVTAAQAAQAKAEAAAAAAANFPSSKGSQQQEEEEDDDDAWTEEVAQAWAQRGVEDGALARDYAEAWALFGAALKVLDEEEAQRKKPVCAYVV